MLHQQRLVSNLLLLTHFPSLGCFVVVVALLDWILILLFILFCFIHVHCLILEKISLWSACVWRKAHRICTRIVKPWFPQVVQAHVGRMVWQRVSLWACRWDHSVLTEHSVFTVSVFQSISEVKRLRSHGATHCHPQETATLWPRLISCERDLNHN